MLLRPIVQDTLFPTICYVAGPSELAYLGQLRGVYEHFGVPMPLMFPRATATLRRFGARRASSRSTTFPLEDLQPQDESALNRLLESQLPASVEQSLQRRRRARSQRAMAARHRGAARRSIPTLAGAAKTTLGKMEHELRSLQSKVIQAAKKRDETLRRQFTRAQAPGVPAAATRRSARSASVYFLNGTVPALVDQLLEELPLDLGQHWVLTHLSASGLGFRLRL